MGSEKNEPTRYEIPIIIKDRKNNQTSPEGKPEQPEFIQNEAEHEILEEGKESNLCESELGEAVNLEEEIRRKEEKIRELEEQVKRLSAEFQNFRQRQIKNYEDSLKYATEDIVSSFIPVLDSIAQAKTMTGKGNDCESMLKGLDLIGNQLSETLAKLGVEEIKAVGEKFNPEFHHALMVEDNDEYPADTVAGEFQKGYMFRGRVIRPSMVRVTRNRKNSDIKS